MTEYHIHCRFCGEKKEITELIKWNLDNFIEGTNLIKENFLKTDFICWESNILPETACITCCEKLERAYDFFWHIQKAQKELFEFFSLNQTIDGNISIKTEIEDDNIGTNTQDPINDDQPVNEMKCPFIIEKEEQNVRDIHDVVKTESNIDDSTILIQNKLYESSRSDLKQVFSSLSVIKNSKMEVPMLVECGTSWKKYKWVCCHCQFEFASVNEVRDHSKRVHSTCFGFKCADCDQDFNHFYIFVDHVRQHRNGLRLHCQFCDQNFPTVEQCNTHSYTHWNTGIMCERCGEILPNQTALDCHLIEFKKAALPRNRKMPTALDVKDHSWTEYLWTCQECGMTHPDLSSLRRHSGRVHRKCFSIKCVDCHAVMLNYRHFMQHAQAHRRFLDDYCFYCNKYCPSFNEVKKHLIEHSLKKICDGCGEFFKEDTELDRHLKEYKVKRRPGNASTEDLTCTVCYKVFRCQSVLRTHQMIHGERQRNHICHICGKGFYNSYGLTNHLSVAHDDTEQVCETCNKVVPRAYYRVHLRGHLNDGKNEKVYICDYCQKVFKRKRGLQMHLVIHDNTFRFKCEVCNKSFRLQKGLRLHSLQHSGERPYKCELCERAFTNWGNCNKHMIRMHGITLARTKLTDQGRVEIDRRTGDIQMRREMGEETKKRIEKILGSVRKGRPKLERGKSVSKSSS